jgi:hypothetical protein
MRRRSAISRPIQTVRCSSTRTRNGTAGESGARLGGLLPGRHLRERKSTAAPPGPAPSPTTPARFARALGTHALPHHPPLASLAPSRVHDFLGLRLASGRRRPERLRTSRRVRSRPPARRACLQLCRTSRKKSACPGAICPSGSALGRASTIDSPTDRIQCFGPLSKRLFDQAPRCRRHKGEVALHHVTPGQRHEMVAALDLPSTRMTSWERYASEGSSR